MSRRVSDRKHADALTRSAGIESLVANPLATPPLVEYQMKPGDVRMHVDTTLGAMTLYTPPMSTVLDIPYTVVARTGSINPVTIVHKESGAVLATLNADNAYVLWYCTGVHWLEIINNQIVP